jgi:hypothetical protein
MTSTPSFRSGPVGEVGLVGRDERIHTSSNGCCHMHMVVGIIAGHLVDEGGVTLGKDAAVGEEFANGAGDRTSSLRGSTLFADDDALPLFE